MKKILHVVSCLERGGTEAFIMNNYRNIDREKFSFDFLVFNEKMYPYTEEIKKLGGNIFFCGLPKVTRLYAFIKNIIRIIKENGPYAAIHAHINIANAWVLFAAYLAKVPIRISHSHSSAGKETRNLIRKIYIKIEEKIILKYATHKFACSRIAGEYLYGKAFEKENCWVIYNGIDVDIFTKEEKSDKLLQEFCIGDDVVFGNITRFDKNKNISFVIDVFKEILNKIPNSILLLGGVDGGQLEVIKNKVEKNGLSEKVCFIGVRDDIPECLKLIDIYLFPSLYEGLGIVMLEAQASGVYCFASTGVSRESDMNLDLIEYLDLDIGEDKWADKICEKINYPKPDREHIKRKFIENGYDIKQTTRLLEEIYGGNTSG